MKISEVIIKPILSEKVNKQTEKANRFAFMVSRKSNKLEIKKAVELFYGAKVKEVNTAVLPGKAKSRNTKAGLLVGRSSARKKAYVTLHEGETIDLYTTV